MKSLSRVRLCNPMDCGSPCSSVCGIFQARVLEWVAISFSRESSPPRDQTRVSCIAGRRFTVWTTGKIIQLEVYKRISNLWNQSFSFWSISFKKINLSYWSIWEESPVQKKECALYPLKTGTLSWPHVTLASWLSSTQCKIKLKTNYPSSGCLRIQALLILGMDSW